MSFRLNLLFLAIALVAAAVFGRLGFWQLGRLLERRRENAASLAQRSLPPVRLGAPIEPGANQRVATSLTNRRVLVSGSYDRSQEIVLRDYSMGGVPGVRIVTPLRPDSGDTATLVLRGFVPAPDAMTPATDSTDEPGRLSVSGVALTISDSGNGAPIQRNGRTTWRRLDLTGLRQRIPYPIRGVYVVAADSAGPGGPGRLGFPRRVDPPGLDEGPHLSYAIQWFAFAVIAVVVGAVVALGRNRGAT